MKKIAIAGKGGVGKTTFSSLLINHLAQQGNTVFAIDADPNPTLAEALGFPADTVGKITPIIGMKELIEERTGAKIDEYGSYFKLNPRVKDIPKQYSVKKGNIHYLMMGMIKGAGGGCACAQNTMLKALMMHLIVKERETVVMDMVAGTEHMGRGTAQAVDIMIIIVEPGMRSIKAAKEFSRMAADLGIQKIVIAGNKINTAEDEEFIKQNMIGFKILGFLPATEEARIAERKGSVLYEQSEQMRNCIAHIYSAMSEDRAKGVLS